MLRVIVLIFLILPCYKSNEIHNACPHTDLYPDAYNNPDCYHDPNVLSNQNSIVHRSGYMLETHNTVTEDGYILTIHRIPSIQPDAQPVFLQHGILCNAIVWTDKFNQSLSYALHDAGYDVWMGNTRGTTYSKKHMNLTTQDPEFWDFNLDTISGNDIPAFLRYIAKTTGKGGSIVYIGHSMGSTVSYMYTSSFPDEAGKLLSGVISLAPVAYLDHHQMLSIIAPFWNVIRTLLSGVGIRSVFVDEETIRLALVKLCRKAPLLCLTMNELSFGAYSGQFPTDKLLVYFSYWPISASVDQFIQYLQICQSGRFQKFDHGITGNKEVYGQDIPPTYDFSAITLPVYLFRGPNDPLTPDSDFQRLVRELGSNLKKVVEMKSSESGFNHLDFIYAKDATSLLFPEILKVLENDLRPR